MATKKKEKAPVVAAATPKPWDGKTARETYCHPCGGMVNGNGCDKKNCPVRS